MNDPVAIGRATAPPLAQDAQTAFLGGLSAVDPTKLVKAEVRRGTLDDWFGDRANPRPIHVIALGKAAPRMVWGLVEAHVPFRGFGASARGVPQPGLEGFQWHTGGHPLPDAGSVAAGKALLEHAATLPDGAPVLVLLSGGASACVEVPTVPVEQLHSAWREWLREGLPIAMLNARRAGLSHLKAGGLAKALAHTDARVWTLADVPAERLDALAGGMMHPTPLHVLADATRLVGGAGATLAGLGYEVYRAPERIGGDAEAAVDAFMQQWRDLPGSRVALIGAGEVDVALAPDAPRGGRCHHAALAAARGVGPGVFLAAASDGRDGTTRAAGAWTDSASWSAGAAAALAAHDAFAYLDARGQSFDVGATGTNVNDLWIALRP